MKVLLFTLIAIIGFPLLAFMVAYSLDVGCFICLYGEQSGGTAEKAINTTLPVIIIGTIGVLLWRRARGHK
jgi:hypothetical protein